MAGCTHCGGKFGLIRYQLVNFNGYLRFCSKRCLKDYRKDVLERMRRQDFFKWLANEKKN